MKDCDAVVRKAVGLLLALQMLRIETARSTWRRRAVGAARLGVGGLTVLQQRRGRHASRRPLPTPGAAG